MKLKCLSLLLGVLFILGDLDAAPKKLTLGDLQMIGVIPRVDEDLPKLNCAGSGRPSNATIEGEGYSHLDDGSIGKYYMGKAFIVTVVDTDSCEIDATKRQQYESYCNEDWSEAHSYLLHDFEELLNNSARDNCEKDLREKMDKVKCPETIECKDSNGVGHSYECRQTWYPEEPECPNIVPAQFIKLSKSELIKYELGNNMCQWVCRVALRHDAIAKGTAETSCGGCANH